MTDEKRPEMGESTTSWGLIYPLLLIEDARGKYSIMDVVRKQSSFITVFRIPKKGKFVRGHVFNADGRVLRYEGECGWPRFGEPISSVLEWLIVPALLSKIQQMFMYFGPKVVGEERLELPSYKERVISCYKAINQGRVSMQLLSLVEDAETFPAVIAAVDWYRYHGGRRDEDGHPIGSD